MRGLRCRGVKRGLSGVCLMSWGLRETGMVVEEMLGDMSGPGGGLDVRM